MFYEVSGKAKNIADKPINDIAVIVNFYDEKGNLLCWYFDIIQDLYIDSVKDFNVAIANIGYTGYFSCDFFEYVEDYDVVVDRYYIR